MESRIVLKTGQYEKMFLQHMAASRRSVALNYFRTGLRILLTKFLETKTQLWKLMWAFLGCCIGSSWSPLLIPGSVGKIGKFIAKINGTSLQVLTRCMNTKIFWKVSWKTVSTCKDRMSGLVCLNFFHYIQDELHVSVLSVSHAILFYGYYPTPYWRNLNRNEYKSNIV